MFSLDLPILSMWNISMISLSQVVLRWFYMITSRLHFLGTTAFMNVYLVFILFRRFTFSIVSHIHAVVFGKFTTRFLLNQLRLAWSWRRQLRNFRLWIWVFLNFVCYNRRHEIWFRVCLDVSALLKLSIDPNW